MKLWLKILTIFLGGGTVWALSFLISIYPDMVMVLSSTNTAIVGLVTYLTGFTYQAR